MLISTANIDEHGQVFGFRLHDATILGLHYDDEPKEMVLSLRREDGTMVAVRFKGIGPVGTIGFRLPAIVSEVMAWPPSETPPGLAELNDGAWNVLFAKDISLSELPKSIRGAIRLGFPYLIHVSCSYGGNLAALCHEIEVTEG